MSATEFTYSSKATAPGYADLSRNPLITERLATTYRGNAVFRWLVGDSPRIARPK